MTTWWPEIPWPLHGRASAGKGWSAAGEIIYRCVENEGVVHLPAAPSAYPWLRDALFEISDVLIRNVHRKGPRWLLITDFPRSCMFSRLLFDKGKLSSDDKTEITKSKDDARNERDARARYLPSFSLMRDLVSISLLKLTTNHYIRKTVCVHRCHTGDCSVIKIKDNVCYTWIILPSELHFIAGTILKLWRVNLLYVFRSKWQKAFYAKNSKLYQNH